jgi:hypothetical protein
MTEREWLVATKLKPMLDFLNGKVSERKLRLFACACCRRIWSLIQDFHCRRAVEVAEQYADGHVTARELFDASQAARLVVERQHVDIAQKLAESAAFNAAKSYDTDWVLTVAGNASFAEASHPYPGNPEKMPQVWVEQSMLLRDIVGNPFRTVTLNPTIRKTSTNKILCWLRSRTTSSIRTDSPRPTRPAWFTSTVVALANGIYQEKAFDRLPILADALQDSGCDSEDILNHCRQPGEHVKGCWVIDHLLEKH